MSYIIKDVFDAIRTADLAGVDTYRVTPRVKGLNVVSLGDDKWGLFAGDSHIKTYRIDNGEIVGC